MRGFATGCLLTAALLLLVVPAAAEDGKPTKDPWLARDKAAHMALSLSIVGFGYHLGRMEGDRDRETARAASLGLALAAGLAKELVDRRRPGGRFSYRDLLFDLAGAGLGMLVFTANR